MAGHLHSSSCGCDHVETLGVEYSLYSKINMESLECLNESADGSGKLVFKPWDERLDRTKVYQQSLIFIKFLPGKLMFLKIKINLLFDEDFVF